MRSPTWDAGHYKWRKDDGTWSTATTYAEDTPIGVSLDTIYRLRCGWGESNDQTDGTSISPNLQFRLNGGSWTTVGSATAVKYANSSQQADGDTETTQRLTSTSGLSWNSRAEWCEDNAPAAQALANVCEEIEYVIEFDSASISAGDVIEFQLTYSSGTAFDSYITMPRAQALAGTLSGSISTPSWTSNAGTGRSINLTTEGTNDWAKWCTAGSSTAFDSKSGGSGISDTTDIITTPSAFELTDGDDFSWTDGTPTSSGSGDQFAQFYSSELFGGGSFTIPASTTEQTCRIFIDTGNSIVQFCFELSDGSAEPQYYYHESTEGTYGGDISVDFKAASASQTLKVTATVWDANTQDYVFLSAVTLADTPPSGDVLTSTDVESASDVNAPAISQIHALTAVDAEATTDTSTPAVGQVHGLISTDIEAASDVSAPAIAESSVLTATDAESATDVSAPTIGQTHSLSAVDAEAASDVSAPAVGQEHALLATDAECASDVSAPTISEVNALSATDSESATDVSGGTLGQIHALIATDTESLSDVSAPTINQTHALTATDAESATDTSVPVFTEVAPGTDDLSATDAESLSDVSAPALTQEHALLATDVEALSDVSTPAIGQAHGLAATDVEAASDVSVPELDHIHNLLVTDAECASDVSSPAIGQVHVLSATDAECACDVSAPVFTEVGSGTDALSATDVEALSDTSAPSIGQEHTLLASDAEANSDVSAPSIGQEHALSASDVEAASDVSAPTLATVHQLNATSVDCASDTSTPVIAQVHMLLATDVEAANDVSTPAMESGVVHLTATDAESASDVSAPALGQIHVLLSTGAECLSEVSVPVLVRTGSVEARGEAAIFLWDPVPLDPAYLPVYLAEHFRRLHEVTRALSQGTFDVLHEEPEKYYTGMLVLADGTDWDPGSGEGIYCYYDAQWNKL
ncbi:MAG: hypothetical protein ACWGQW_05470 [bacterium]